MSIVVKNRTIGEGRPLICGPIVAKTMGALIKECNSIVGKPIDMVEWRIDYFLKNNDRCTLIEAANELKRIIKYLPVLITYRTAHEGGEENYSSDKKLPEMEYMELVRYIADNSIGDMVDIEVARSDDKTMTELVKYAQNKGLIVVSSMHDFHKTPEKCVMEDVFARMKKVGADIFKIAVMPNTQGDVLRLMDFSTEAKKKYDNPIITISMGRLGIISRVAGELDGSAVTFASITKESAPGQISCVKLISMLRNVSVMNGNIYLVGFMGCGKSTVARELEKRTGMAMVDIDAAIVEREQTSIADIFENRGEAAFRNIETEVLLEESKKEGRIIACGGGAVLKDENITIMKRYGTVVLLTATPETIYGRVCNDNNRPLLNNNMSVEHIAKMLESRREYYERAADIVINTDKMDILDIVFKIKKLI